ncbi:MAG: hypothetical protein KF752_11280 [Pirellulaceae bacterium]|nr:hypothetical protein [Pirellulaceae bacterium]
MRRTTIAMYLVLASCSALRAETITQWDFQFLQGELAIGTNVANVGSGAITHLNGVSHPGFNSGNGSSDPVQPGQAHQTDSYHPQSTSSGTRGVQFSVDTTGFQNLVCKFDLRTSNTSSRWYQVRYTTDGVNFVDHGSPIRLERYNVDNIEIGVGDVWSNQQIIDLTNVPGVNNNPNFAFQVVSVFSPVAFTEFLSGTNYAADTAYEAARNRPTGFGAQSNYAGGTWRFDMVTVSGEVMSGMATSFVTAQVYHNGFSGGGASPWNAVDPHKQPIRRGEQPTTFGLVNLTNDSRGLNGVVLDFDNLTSLDDVSLVYKMSPQGAFSEAGNPVSAWENAPTPTSVVLYPELAEADNNDRILILWADNAIQNRYLSIKVTIGSATIELYVGHLLGETTGPDLTPTFTVSFADITEIKNTVAQIVNAGGLTDIDKNGTVAFADITAMRNNISAQLTQITIPAE